MTTTLARRENTTTTLGGSMLDDETDFDLLPEDELENMGLHRCQCGAPISKDENPDWKHCE